MLMPILPGDPVLTLAGTPVRASCQGRMLRPLRNPTRRHHPHFGSMPPQPERLTFRP